MLGNVSSNSEHCTVCGAVGNRTGFSGPLGGSSHFSCPHNPEEWHDYIHLLDKQIGALWHRLSKKLKKRKLKKLVEIKKEILRLQGERQEILDTHVAVGINPDEITRSIPSTFDHELNIRDERRFRRDNVVRKVFGPKFTHKERAWSSCSIEVICSHEWKACTPNPHRLGNQEGAYTQTFASWSRSIICPETLQVFHLGGRRSYCNSLFALGGSSKCSVPDGFRAGVIKDLERFNVRFPDISSRSPVVALGGCEKGSNVPYLYSWPDTRTAEFRRPTGWEDGLQEASFETIWCASCVFLFVPDL